MYSRIWCWSDIQTQMSSPVKPQQQSVYLAITEYTFQIELSILNCCILLAIFLKFILGAAWFVPY